jgi:hypothetical protein
MGKMPDMRVVANDGAIINYGCMVCEKRQGGII